MKYPASHRITFIAYRKNSADVSLAVVFDSRDSSLTVQDFGSFETEKARKWLFDLFLEDIKLREHETWINELQVLSLIDGRPLEECSEDQRFDVQSLVQQARYAAQEQFDHVGS